MDIAHSRACVHRVQLVSWSLELLLSVHLLSTPCDQGLTLSLAMSLSIACYMLPKATKSWKETTQDKIKTCQTVGSESWAKSFSTDLHGKRGLEYFLSLWCHPTRENECFRVVWCVNARVCLHACSHTCATICVCLCVYQYVRMCTCLCVGVFMPLWGRSYIFT